MAAASSMTLRTGRATAARAAPRRGTAAPRAAPRRAAARAQQKEIAVDKPLGFSVGGKPGEEGVFVTFVNPVGNGAKAGIKMGDQILYTSSFFGDEMWPCENVGFTKTTISNNGRDYMDFIVNKGAPILPPRNKLPAPPRFGKSLSKRQLETATHICLDCGFIYFKKQPFAELDGGYQCPQCAAPKSRFAEFDKETGLPKGGFNTPLVSAISGLVAAGAIAYFTYLGLS